jgi:hypothetical protein
LLIDRSISGVVDFLEAAIHPIAANQPSTNQPTRQSINQPANQSNNQSANPQINQPLHKSRNQ